MSIQIRELINAFEEIAPPIWQENYDNTGLLVGSLDGRVNKALLSLDCTEAVIDEAIKTGCDLIICHHPVIFSGLKRLNGNNYVERVVIKSIQNGISIYAIHTQLDNAFHHGVNAKIAEKLGLIHTRILDPKPGLLFKLTIYVPLEYFETLRTAIFEAGAGNIGNYEECGFALEGKGSFKPKEGANPHTGAVGVRHEAHEIKWEVLVSQEALPQVIKAMKAAHPYEEVAHELVLTENLHTQVGSGMLGELEEALSVEDFLLLLKDRMELNQIKFTPTRKTNIKTVAVCGGAGSFLIKKARTQADAYISSDIKYHEFFDSEGTLLLCDIGHYESEKHTVEIFREILSKKFPNFANIFATTNTNPVQYK